MTQSLRSTTFWTRCSVLVIVVGLFLGFFPLFHLVPLQPIAGSSVGNPLIQDIGAFAEKFWTDRLLGSRDRASDAAAVAIGLVKDPAATIKSYAHEAGIGGLAYFYVKGSGRVVSVERSRLLLVLDGAGSPEIDLQTGAIFGNAVRDGTGLVSINDLPSLQDYNTLSAELNQRVELRVLPALRSTIGPGARIEFAGCAEAVDSSSGSTKLSVVPIFAEVK